MRPISWLRPLSARLSLPRRPAPRRRPCPRLELLEGRDLPSVTINTLAGNGEGVYGGDGGPAKDASLSQPSAVAVDASGNTYVIDDFNERVRKITPGGLISTFAGNGFTGDFTDGEPATSASFQFGDGGGLAVDAGGDVYIADPDKGRVSKVTPDGVIHAFAGDGDSTDEGVPAIDATLAAPFAVAVDARGDVFIADASNNDVREVTTDGLIHTVAGAPPMPGSSGGFAGDGGPATAAQLNSPTDVAVDTNGDLYIVDSGNNRIRQVTADGIIHTLAGNGTAGFSGDGGPATAAALNFDHDGGVAVAGSGIIYIADTGNNRIREVSDGNISTVAGTGAAGFSGDGGNPGDATLDTPTGLAVDAGGNVYIGDTNNNRVRVLAQTQHPADSIAAYDASGFNPFGTAWYLRDGTSTGPVNSFVYGAAGWKGVAGDWTGQGLDTVGAVDGTGASNPFADVWYLRNSNSAGLPDVTPFAFGAAGWTPLAGHWSGGAVDGIGAYDPATSTFYLKGQAGSGFADLTVPFGPGGFGLVPLAGDWTGSGSTSIGLYDPRTATFYLRQGINPADGTLTATFQYGAPGWLPVVGDWDGDGTTTIGVVDPATGMWYLRNSNSAGFPDITPFPYGLPGWSPLAGHFSQAELAVGGPVAADPLPAGALQATVAGALARLQAEGAGPALVQKLASAQYAVAPLSPGVLGLADPGANLVLLSADAAGYGWFVDPTPGSDEEFTASGAALPGGPAAGKEDLLSVVLHEMGHLAGRPDTTGGGLMDGVLPTGTRRTEALDAVFGAA